MGCAPALDQRICCFFEKRFPSHRHLKHAVKFVQRHGFRHQHAPPDHRADPGQPGFQLQNRSFFRCCPGIRHATRQQEAPHNASCLTPEILMVPVHRPRCFQEYNRQDYRCLQANPLSFHPNKRPCAGSLTCILTRNVLVPSFRSAEPILAGLAGRHGQAEATGASGRP